MESQLFEIRQKIKEIWVKHIQYTNLTFSFTILFCRGTTQKMMENAFFPWRCRHGWEVIGTWLRTKIKGCGCGFNPRPPMPAIFQPRIAKKINEALSVRVIVICSDHNIYGGTLIKVLVTHQHRLSLYCTRLLLLCVEPGWGTVHFEHLVGSEWRPFAFVASGCQIPAL